MKDYYRRSHTPLSHKPMTYHEAWAHGIYALRDKERYTPQPIKTPPPPDMLSLNGKLERLQAEINHVENKVNGLKKMAYNHSKGSKKYNTYSLE